jgi:pilus assembly protein Flp/PilA
MSTKVDPEQNGQTMLSIIRSSRLQRFTMDEVGATAIEYALIASGVSIAIIAAVNSVGTTMNALYYDKLLSMF